MLRAETRRRTEVVAAWRRGAEIFRQAQEQCAQILVAEVEQAHFRTKGRGRGSGTQAQPP